MPPKKTKFIEKKNAVTFHLVHRSQRDPLQADEEAPQHVLLPVDGKTHEEDTRREEQRKFGVFYEDDYNYLNHLKDVDELHNVEPVATGDRVLPHQLNTDTNATTFSLPSTVFGSSTETEVGLLNKAAPVPGPKPDWDPDVVAALDEDFDFDNPENQLDDDFVVMANDEGADLSNSEQDAGVSNENDDIKLVQCARAVCDEEDTDSIASDAADFSDHDSDIGSYGDQQFDDVETKSRFTNYSMTSSVIRRNEGLSLLDDRFEKLYEEYDDVEIGALDHEDIGGCLNTKSLVLDTVMEEFEKQQQSETLKDVMQKYTGGEIDYVSSEDDMEDDLVKMKIEAPKAQWDCESILSTHSNLYNHPKLIVEPKKDKQVQMTKRAEIPAGVLPQRGLTRKQLEAEERRQEQVSQASTHRPRDENSEQRRERKQAIKEERKMRRIEKKMNKVAFNDERVRQNKEQNNLKQNLQGVTIT